MLKPSDIGPLATRTVIVVPLLMDANRFHSIGEVKAMKNPPAGVRLVMEAGCVMKQIKPDRVKDPNSGSKGRYWC